MKYRLFLQRFSRENKYCLVQKVLKKASWAENHTYWYISDIWVTRNAVIDFDLEGEVSLHVRLEVDVGVQGSCLGIQNERSFVLDASELSSQWFGDEDRGNDREYSPLVLWLVRINYIILQSNP